MSRWVWYSHFSGTGDQMKRCSNHYSITPPRYICVARTYIYQFCLLLSLMTSILFYLTHSILLFSRCSTFLKSMLFFLSFSLSWNVFFLFFWLSLSHRQLINQSHQKVFKSTPTKEILIFGDQANSSDCIPPSQLIVTPNHWWHHLRVTYPYIRCTNYLSTHLTYIHKCLLNICMLTYFYTYKHTYISVYCMLTNMYTCTNKRTCM